MRKFALYLLVGAIINVFAGSALCADPESTPFDRIIKRIDAVRDIYIPEPTDTRYESDPKAKAIYTEEYIKSYRLVLAAVMGDCHMGVKGPYEEAFQDGWIDGRRTAMKKNPEKAAEMYGLSLEEYLRYFGEGK